MKKSLSAWQTAGVIFTGVAGVLLHFLFGWTGENPIVALFSPVNESIWEHLKLLFFPMFVFAFIERRYVAEKHPNFWCVKLVGILSALVLIPVLYYTINGMFGSAPDWINIAIFFVVVLVSYLFEGWLFKKNILKCKSPKTALLILWIIAILFAILTFIPPRIPLFIDPRELI